MSECPPIAQVSECSLSALRVLKGQSALRTQRLKKVLVESRYYRDEQTRKLEAGQNVSMRNVTKI